MTVSDRKGDQDAIWCPEKQVYSNGNLPATEEASNDLKSIRCPKTGRLNIFGYGSLCWKPGDGTTLSKVDEGVITSKCHVKGWRRCWAQRSTDHRGTIKFPGLVCTLLTDSEVNKITQSQAQLMHEGVEEKISPYKSRNGVISDDEKFNSSTTQGLLYSVPSHLVDQCLQELDFREKGGYARDVIDVKDDETGEMSKALVYRGTPENPAFCIRSLLDLPLAAAIMSVAIGPSGRNDEYLYNLDEFLTDFGGQDIDDSMSGMSVNSFALPSKVGSGTDKSHDTGTKTLAMLVRTFHQKANLHFLYGAGSNQSNQLLLQQSSAKNNAPGLVNLDEAHDLKEILLVVPKNIMKDKLIGFSEVRSQPKALYAGGSHSGLLTDQGILYLWGCKDSGQLGQGMNVYGYPKDGLLGRTGKSDDIPPMVSPLNMRVEVAAFGHAHTLVIERNTGMLYAFGDNSRGQVSGRRPRDTKDSVKVPVPTVPEFAKDKRFVAVAAGLHHSAAITEHGELVTFGFTRYGMCVPREDIDRRKMPGVAWWRPEDGSRLIAVSCGQKHTMVLDEHGRVWTMGDNKHGQLGRNGGKSDGPSLVNGTLGEKGSGCIAIDCGWSHCIAIVLAKINKSGQLDQEKHIYGWGRNDKGQLGCEPYLRELPLYALYKDIAGRKIKSFSCGAESSMLVDESGKIWGCGWNDHGNISTGDNSDVYEMTEIVGTTMRNPKLDQSYNSEIIVAAGGAHFLSTLM
eukprot:CAMPEP_0184870952 /NCGR_PEP_ID=MMETSP0580-20130426/39340_1 /TAXON_ID=1118495 /ORGANISM="Dactyliosolen fragilissimus" /LENGTH=735 /DNA_ID=CAMNT_0027373351 /DNA_START=173 /DNA_END=2377 /DNA_ORIENTATION=-